MPWGYLINGENKNHLQEGSGQFDDNRYNTNRERDNRAAIVPLVCFFNNI